MDFCIKLCFSPPSPLLIPWLATSSSSKYTPITTWLANQLIFQPEGKTTLQFHFQAKRTLERVRSVHCMYRSVLYCVLISHWFTDANLCYPFCTIQFVIGIFAKVCTKVRILFVTLALWQLLTHVKNQKKTTFQAWHFQDAHCCRWRSAHHHGREGNRSIPV